jgi:flagellar biogenesis protein FliO
MAEQLMLSWFPLLGFVGLLVFLVARSGRSRKREENMLKQLEKIESLLSEISRKIDRR